MSSALPRHSYLGMFIDATQKLLNLIVIIVSINIRVLQICRSTLDMKHSFSWGYDFCVMH